jgi:hypothetical protein
LGGRVADRSRWGASGLTEQLGLFGISGYEIRS